jgi:hypothetical protein
MVGFRSSPNAAIFIPKAEGKCGLRTSQASGSPSILPRAPPRGSRPIPGRKADSQFFAETLRSRP